MKKILFPSLLFLLSLLLFSCASDNPAAGPTGTGQGGSMARFAVVGDYLYVVDSRLLHVYDISTSSNPLKLKDIELGVNIETIFPYQNRLFIGSMEGMHIYDIAAPESPVYLSTYRHVTSCDPVVVQDNIAYVTLRTDNACARGLNQLDLIDISNPAAPTLINSFPMDSPFGLGISDTTLFVCEGKNGLTVLNVADPHNIEVSRRFDNLHAFDVIPAENSLILTGNSGIFQFDYAQLEELSHLPTSNCE
ncbi:LVIVD repeat-containing protein [Nafulsella turpanensis]|uniref:LVIVD repeat-containing protein n=1 Tax=Nafulsella turpanensis TaxID=1265690 RepID=UPI000349C41B|nr:hypothetical protein [Nafulsella turpanensis]